MIKCRQHFLVIINIAFITFLITSYIFIWVIYFQNSVHLSDSDFRAFYGAGEIAIDYNMSQVYNSDLELITQENITGTIIPQSELLTYNHPPLLLPILTFIAPLSYQIAYVIYCLILILLSIVSLFYLKKSLNLKNWPIFSIWLTLIAAFLFEPLFISILKGQDTVLLLLGLMIWFTGMQKGDDRQAGLGLALTTIRPQISIFLAIPFIFKRRKVFAWYFWGASILVLYSYLLVGKEGFLDFFALLRLSSEGQNFGLNLSAMFNFTGLILRKFPSIDLLLLNTIKWILFGITLVIVIMVWIRSQKIELRHLVLLVIASLVASPHLHYHDLAALLLPLIGMVLIWVNGGVIQVNIAPIIILLISIVFLIGNIITPLYHILPYLIMIFLLIGSWSPDRFRLSTRITSL